MFRGLIFVYVYGVLGDVDSIKKNCSFECSSAASVSNVPTWNIESVSHRRINCARDSHGRNDMGLEEMRNLT